MKNKGFFTWVKTTWFLAVILLFQIEIDKKQKDFVSQKVLALEKKFLHTCYDFDNQFGMPFMLWQSWQLCLAIIHGICNAVIGAFLFATSENIEIWHLETHKLFPL